MKKITFLCGSPRGTDSSSYAVAQYLACFLDYDYEFIDVANANLSYDPAEAEPEFQNIVASMNESNIVIWTFGAICWHVPVQLKLLIDKLFAQKHRFEGRIAAGIMSGTHWLDDYILENLKFISEQLGFGYLGDISAEGLPGGYADYVETEDACRILAGQINNAIASDYIPFRASAFEKHEDLSPLHFGAEFNVDPRVVEKTSDKKILVITGHKLSGNPAARSVYETIQNHSRNRVEFIEIEKKNIRPCRLNYQCLMKEAARCIQEDDFESIRERMLAADAIVFIAHCSSTFVDAYLQTFLARGGSILVMPPFKNKHGFVVATGGGRLGSHAVSYLDKVIRRYGLFSVGAFIDGNSDNDGFRGSIEWAVQNLDQAMEEKWKVADRCTAKSEHYYMRENAAKFGMVFRALYKHFKKNKLFDFPLPVFVTTILYQIMRINWLVSFAYSQLEKLTIAQRKKRLNAILKKINPGKGKLLINS